MNEELKKTWDEIKRIRSRYSELPYKSRSCILNQLFINKKLEKKETIEKVLKTIYKIKEHQLLAYKNRHGRRWIQRRNESRRFVDAYNNNYQQLLRYTTEVIPLVVQAKLYGETWTGGKGKREDLSTFPPATDRNTE